MLIALVLYGVLHVVVFTSVIIQVLLSLFFIDLFIFIVEVDSVLHVLKALFFCDDIGEAGSGQVTLGE